MRWPDALQAFRDEALADSAITDVVGERIVRAGTTAWEPDSIRVTLSSEAPVEIWERHTMIWQVFARREDDCKAVERALRRILHRDLPVEIQGVQLWSQITGAQDIHTPDEQQVWGRHLDHQCEVIREKYDPS